MAAKKNKKVKPNPSAGVDAEIANSECDQHYFEIHVRGVLSDIWADWFEGFTIECLEDGEMVLSGLIVDQSALMGVLNKLARLNLAIISLNEVNTKNHKETE